MRSRRSRRSPPLPTFSAWVRPASPRRTTCSSRRSSSASDAFAVTRVDDGRVIEVNDAFLRLLRLDRDRGDRQDDARDRAVGRPGRPEAPARDCSPATARRATNGSAFAPAPARSAQSRCPRTSWTSTACPCILADRPRRDGAGPPGGRAAAQRGAVPRPCHVRTRGDLSDGSERRQRVHEQPLDGDHRARRGRHGRWLDRCAPSGRPDRRSTTAGTRARGTASRSPWNSGTSSPTRACSTFTRAQSRSPRRTAR